MKDQFTKQWIIENSLDIVSQYEPGILTLRSLHYRLVSKGMTNDIHHYKRVVVAMESARWDDIIPFETFSDLEREMVGSTAYEETDVNEAILQGKNQVQAWMEFYTKNRWENQPYYVEVLIEKKALQGVFQKTCKQYDVALGACKGYPSLTFLHNTFLRFQKAETQGKRLLILYFGDYDPSGEDIPRSIIENLSRFGVDVELRRIALMREQVELWNLPPAPAKITDSRTANWNGLGQVELDAVEPEILMQLLKDSIDIVFDKSLHRKLMLTETEERRLYQDTLKKFVSTL